MEVDYIIVGFGLAGMAFVSVLEEKEKSFLVYEDSSQTASNVSGGAYNPVVLKRFTPVWQGADQLKIALPFYKRIEKKFKKKYDYKFNTYRIFKSIEEQNNWFTASDNPLLSPFMDSNIIRKEHPGILSNFGYGKLKHTGRIDTKTLLSDWKIELTKTKKIRFESFKYQLLSFKKGTVLYKDIKAKNILFCEGYGMRKNPYFKDLPMNEAKGELLTIHAPKLNVNVLLKAAVFVMPLGNHYYKVGATFNWKDKTPQSTEEGKKELLEKLNTFIKLPFKIVEQSAGIRPTTKDRRPLLGKHSKHPQLTILNGLGTRGVMLAPKMAMELYNHIEKNTPLDKEIDIKRFK